MRNTTMQSVYNSMPSDLQNVIKTVKVYTAKTKNDNTPVSIGDLTLDRVFLPGAVEINNSANIPSGQYRAESGQKEFPIFTSNRSRIKKLSNGSRSANPWWTRSPYYNIQYDFYVVKAAGDCTAYDVTEYESCGVCFCFNV